MLLCPHIRVRKDLLGERPVLEGREAKGREAPLQYSWRASVRKYSGGRHAGDGVQEAAEGRR